MSYNTLQVDNKEWAYLGALRFCLAAAVVCQHLESFAADRLTRTIMSLGAFPAVAGFLIISGFSISASYNSNPRGYYLRRVIRILPVYVSAMLCAVVPQFCFGREIYEMDGRVERVTLSQWLGNLFMLNPFIRFPLPTNGALWTVQVEFMYYLLAPIVSKLRDSMRWAIIAMSLAIYLSVPLYTDSLLWNKSFGLSLAAMLWLWILGWQLYKARASRSVVLVALCTVALGFMLYQGDPRIRFHRCLSPLLAICTIVYSHRLPPLGISLQRGMTWLGDISYEVYAIHLPVMIVVYTAVGAKWPLVYAVAILATAAVVLHLIDRPIRRWATTWHCDSKCGRSLSKLPLSPKSND